MGRPHIIALDAVAPVWADAWVIIGQARTGVAMKPVATERAIVSFLIVFPPLESVERSETRVCHGTMRLMAGSGQHTCW
jgi:hypothetical protein